MKLGDLMGFSLQLLGSPNGGVTVRIRCQRCDWTNADKPERITLMELARDALEHIREDQCPR